MSYRLMMNERVELQGLVKLLKVLQRPDQYAWLTDEQSPLGHTVAMYVPESFKDTMEDKTHHQTPECCEGVIWLRLGLLTHLSSAFA